MSDIDPEKLSVLAGLHGISADEHSGCVPGFVQVSRSEFGYEKLLRKDLREEIVIGFYEPGQYGDMLNGTTGEFSLAWEAVDFRPSVRLEAYDHAWHALVCMPELLVALAEWGKPLLTDDWHPCVTPEQVVETLLRLGFRDFTRTKPNGVPYGP